MKITRIELAGVSNTKLRNGTPGMPAAFATINRKAGNNCIHIELLTPTGQRTHHVQADCDEDIRSMAECLQETLDGVRGTNGDIHGYYMILQYFAD